MKIDPNEPAMPQMGEVTNYTGLTIRAEIASRCLQGILSKSHDFAWAYEESAQLSIKFADALISELSKEN